MSTSRLQFRSHYVEWAIFAVYGTIPNAAAERRDVNLFGVLGIGDDAMPPLEIEARYARPVLAPIRGPPRGRFKSGSIQDVRVAWICGDVVNVAVTIEHLSPGRACVF